MLQSPRNPFQKTDNAGLIASSISSLPAHWSLTPLQDKAPKRRDWQTEPFIPHDLIADLILEGEQAVSKRTGKTYTRYWSGYGLRTGEASGGLLAIDVDGATAQLILEAMSGSNIPVTVSWTSGKPGRYQLVFQIPADIRPKLQNFTRYVVTQWQGLETAKDEAGRFTELLEFRYNFHQSALPPSRHPDTGSYKWIDSPKNTPVAIAPSWLCNLLLSFAQEEAKELEAQAERIKQVEQTKQARKLNPVSSNGDSLFDILDQSLARLGVEDIFNWSGHNWTFQGRDKWIGYCPRHNSKSGQSFQVNPNTYQWYCFGCEAGGHAAQYIHFLNGGSGTPKGKDFAEVVKELANNAGIVIHHGGYIPSVEKAEAELTEKELEQQRKEEFYRRVTAVQRPLRTLSYKPDLIFTPQDGRYLPSLVKKVPESGIVLLKAPKGAGKSQGIQELKDYLCHGELKTGEVIEGTPILEFIDGLNKRFNSTTPRIALGREQAIRWCYTWLGDISATEESIIDGTQADKINSIDCTGSTFDSFWKLSGRDFSNTVWVLDECELGLSHLALSSTLKGKRPLILRLFAQKVKECLENGGLIILSDADLTDISVDYIRSFCPDAPIFGVEYQGNPDPWNVNFYTGKKDGFLQQIVDWFDPEFNPDHQDPIHIFVDNKEEGQALEQILLKKYPELGSRIGGIIRIDSSVTQTDFGRKFVERPNESIKELKPRCLISTQSLGVGASIDIPWFKHVFGLCFGTSEPSQARQGLARVRQNVPRSIWAADKGKMEHGLKGSFFPEEIKNNLFAHHESTSELIGIAQDLTAQSIQNQCDAEFLPAFIKTLESMMGISKSWNNPHLDLMAKFQARRNYSMSQFALQLRQELLDEGHDLTDFGCVEELGVGDEIKEQKKENRWIESQAIAQAPDITEEEARKILKSPSATEGKLRSATKVMLKKELPGVELTPEFVHKVSVSDKGRWKNSVRLFWSCQNLEATRERDLASWRYKLKQFSEGDVYLPDINTLSLQCKALIQSGIFEFIKEDSSRQFIDESPEMRGFLHWGEQNRKLLHRAFGMKPGKSSIRFANKLLSKIGLKLKDARTEKLPNGNKLIWYSLDTNLMADPDRLTILEALDRRWQIQQEEKAQREQAWIEKQAIAAQNPIPHRLESQGVCIESGVRNTHLYTITGVPDTERSPCRERDTAIEGCGYGLVEKLAAVASREEFWEAVAGYSDEAVEDALALQDSQPVRQRLRSWHEATVDAVAVDAAAVNSSSAAIASHSDETPRCEIEAIASQPEKALEVGDRVRVKEVLLGGRASLARGLEGVVQAVSALGRLTVQGAEFGIEFCARSEVEFVASG